MKGVPLVTTGKTPFHLVRAKYCKYSGERAPVFFSAACASACP